MRKQANVDWKKWNRDELLQRVKCYFGYHKMSYVKEHICFDTYDIFGECLYCNKEVYFTTRNGRFNKWFIHDIKSK